MYYNNNNSPPPIPKNQIYANDLFWIKDYTPKTNRCKCNVNGFQ